jgi:hypothetical protein
MTTLSNAGSCNNYPNTGPASKDPAKGNDGTYVQSIPVKPGDRMYV